MNIYQELAKQIKPEKPQQQPVYANLGKIVAVNTDNTVDVQLGPHVLEDVNYLSTFSPAINQTVLMLWPGNFEPIIIGTPA